MKNNMETIVVEKFPDCHKVKFPDGIVYKMNSLTTQELTCKLQAFWPTLQIIINHGAHSETIPPHKI